MLRPLDYFMRLEKFRILQFSKNQKELTADLVMILVVDPEYY